MVTSTTEPAGVCQKARPSCQYSSLRRVVYRSDNEESRTQIDCWFSVPTTAGDDTSLHPGLILRDCGRRCGERRFTQALFTRGGTPQRGNEDPCLTPFIPRVCRFEFLTDCDFPGNHTEHQRARPSSTLAEVDMLRSKVCGPGRLPTYLESAGFQISGLLRKPVLPQSIYIAAGGASAARFPCGRNIRKVKLSKREPLPVRVVLYGPCQYPLC